ncbi:uncharacterized protein LOC110235120, partial [Exaiptasia diaphana]|uniref:Uncharacterized protein n=1 Tax=Exaiptasia diaphana TaxID=2652724 RepID=A0A913WYR1_EXADI
MYFRGRVQVQHEPWYVTVRRKLYETRSDFKFSTQFLSAVIVSLILVYQLTIVFATLITALKKMFETSKYPSNIISMTLLDYYLAATFIASFIAILQLLMFIKSHRSDVLKTYQTKEGQLPDERATKPKMLVGKSLRFCGYQIAFTAIGMVFLAISTFFLLLPICVLKIVHDLYGKQLLLELLKEIAESTLPLVITPLLILLALLLLCTFVFRDRT